MTPVTLLATLALSLPIAQATSSAAIIASGVSQSVSADSGTVQGPPFGCVARSQGPAVVNFALPFKTISATSNYFAFGSVTQTVIYTGATVSEGSTPSLHINVSTDNIAMSPSSFNFAFSLTTAQSYTLTGSGFTLAGGPSLIQSAGSGTLAAGSYTFSENANLAAVDLTINAAAPTPEPASLSLLAVAALPLLKRRR